MPTDSDLYTPTQPSPGSGNMLTIPGAVAAINAKPQPTQTQTQKQNTSTSTSTAKTSSAANPATAGVQTWADALFEHYLGRPASAGELQVVASQGWSPDRLKQYIRAQPSYVPGVTIGGYEDMYNASRNEFLKYLGHEPTDQDIRDLVQRNVRDEFSINNYLKNRPDVVALHPGAPIDLTDEEFTNWHAQTNAHYQQNLKRDANFDEARQAYIDRNAPAPFGPASQQKTDELTPALKIDQQSGGLSAPGLISPTSRAY